MQDDRGLTGRPTVFTKLLMPCFLFCVFRSSLAQRMKRSEDLQEILVGGSKP
jgi:hypothetical protein